MSRENLIHKEIERRVALMQTVIELGRVVRDRKTLPLKVGITLNILKRRLKLPETCEENDFISDKKL